MGEGRPVEKESLRISTCVHVSFPLFFVFQWWGFVLPGFHRAEEAIRREGPGRPDDGLL